MRKKVERYAVDRVLATYKAQGWTVVDVGDTSPWDVTASKGATELHIEVKGSTTARSAIDLTEGEVRHAEGHPTVLVVIDEVHVDPSGNASGGVWREWSDWAPDRDKLVPTAYRYPLP